MLKRKRTRRMKKKKRRLISEKSLGINWTNSERLVGGGNVTGSPIFFLAPNEALSGARWHREFTHSGRRLRHKRSGNGGELPSLVVEPRSRSFCCSFPVMSFVLCFGMGYAEEAESHARGTGGSRGKCDTLAFCFCLRRSFLVKC